MDHWVLKTIKLCHGFPLHPSFPPLYRRDLCHETLILNQVQSLLSLGAVEKFPLQHCGEGFYSQFLLILNPSGGKRSILDLHGLNKYIRYIRFLMTTLATILPSLNHSCRFATLYLQDAYFQYNEQPFDLSSIPWVFTK